MKEKLMEVLKNYRDRAVKRKNNIDLPARPLTENEVEVFMDALSLEGLAEESFEIFNEEKVDKLLLRLLKNEVRRGTFPASYAKAKGLYRIITGESSSPYLSPQSALEMLAEMKGGAASAKLIDLLEAGVFTERVVEILQETVLINKSEVERLKKLAESQDECKEIFVSWANRDFADGWNIKDQYRGVCIKVGDNISTGHLSPSKEADSRTDQPLHALHIMEGRQDEEDFLDRLQEIKKDDDRVFLAAGEALGEGSSRKSATYTLLQVLGKPVAGEPEIKEGGVVFAISMAPIFKKSLVASGMLPVITDTAEINEGDQLLLKIAEKRLIINKTREIEVKLPTEYQLDKIAAGGMKYFDAGNELQKMAVDYCQETGLDFDQDKIPDYSSTIAYKKTPAQTLAQKIVAMNRLDGKETMLPGETAEVAIRGVFSQDTTGPMTLDEYQAMAGGDFGAEFVIQSLCHTGECPSSEDRDRHRFLDQFITERGGLCLEPGEGIIHTIGNRFILPTDVIVGGDSHTRTPMGVSFPAASDIVAGAMKYGKQALTMDESVRVIFKGRPGPGITPRDLVSTLVVFAEKTVGKDIYNGRIIEMEGTGFLDATGRYILSNAVAERSSSAATIPADQKTLQILKDNLKYLEGRHDATTSPSVKRTIASIKEYLKDPLIPVADPGANYVATIEIPLDQVEEPMVAKPHHPDNVAPVSEVAGIELDEIYIGSCVGGDTEGIRDAARILKGERIPHGVNFVICPASRDIYQELAADNSLATLSKAGATIIMPGCGLCMGNKRRIGSGAVALTTTTRNYQARIGPADSKTYLGSAQMAAVAAIDGKFPTFEKYLEYVTEKK